MKSSFLIAAIAGLFVSAAAAQKNVRTFDNFDRAQGVNVILPPAASVTNLVKKAPKKRRGTKWEIRVEDKLVKKTAQSMRVSVTDGLATREPAVYPGPARLSMGTSSSLKGFTTGNPMHDGYIVDSSRRYGIDPLLIYSQMHQESTFNVRATSNKGARGLMQLMPATARRFGVSQIYDPKQNIEAGVKYMRWLLDTFNGDLVLALAGYNAGEGAVMKYGWQIPPYRETQEYVRRITARYNSISDPRYLQTARRVSGELAAKLERNESRPLTVYEPDALAVRLPDGKIRLVNQ